LREADAVLRKAAANGPDFLEALARGLAVIQAFGIERRPMTLAEIARAVDLPRATARRALITLEALGHVESDGRLFRLTPRVLTLAAAYLGSNGITTVLQPALEALALELGVACSAAVLDGPDVVFVAYARATRMPSLSSMIGERLPAFCSALGRVLLGAMEDAALDAFLAGLSPQPVTPHTVLDPAAIRAAILAARAEGHALVEQEAEQGFLSLALPLRRFDGRVVAAVNIGCPAGGGGAKARLLAMLPRLREAAENISGQMI
jgi:IclR family pca regulon transcriptional regulator